VRLRPFGSLSPAPKGCVLRRPPLNAAEEDAASMCLQTKTRICCGWTEGRVAASAGRRKSGSGDAARQSHSMPTDRRDVRFWRLHDASLGPALPRLFGKGRSTEQVVVVYAMAR
jgi:hypothetical protein